MSTIFLFGAGASYGSGDCLPCNPALGNGEEGLFQALVKFSPDGYFAHIEKNEPHLAKIFTSNFEDGMEHIRNDDAKFENGDDLREMAKYFIQFTPRPGNLYLKLLQILRNKLPHCTFATINYDLLIELSADSLDLRFDYGNALSKKNNNVKMALLRICRQWKPRPIRGMML